MTEKRRRRTREATMRVFLAVACAIFCVLCASSGSRAFYTFNAVGGAIHERITRDALGQFDFCEASITFIDKGNTSQDIPATAKFSAASHHFDCNEVGDSYGYMTERFNHALEQARTAGKDNEARKRTLYAFGEMLHTAQDFYAHTNYVELWLVKSIDYTPSGMPLVKWNQIALKPKTRIGIRSGYFYYAGVHSNENFDSRSLCTYYLKQEFEGTEFASDKIFLRQTGTFVDYLKYAVDTTIDMTHYDINKDNEKSYAGKKINPATGQHLYSYALDLATR